MNSDFSLSCRLFMKQSISLAVGLLLAASLPHSVFAQGSNPDSTVEYRFYRNATAKMSYGGFTFLLDPMLSAKGELPSFAGIAPNPTVELPVSPGEIIADIDAIIVSHTHSDHFDAAAAALLDKSMPVFTPRNGSAVSGSDPTATVSYRQELLDFGFTDVREIDTDGTDSIKFGDVTLTQVWGRHGKGVIGDLMGGVNGIIFAAPQMPTIYWAGDTIMDAAEVAPILERFTPDVVIAHTGGPVIEALSPELLLMDAEQGIELIEMANRYNPAVQVVAIHMDALDHCFSTRDDLRSSLTSLPSDIVERVTVPEDGDILRLGGN